MSWKALSRRPPLLPVRPVADDKAASAVAGISLKVNQWQGLGELGKAELGVLDKGVDRRARQEALAAVLVKGLGRIKVIERRQRRGITPALLQVAKSS